MIASRILLPLTLVSFAACEMEPGSSSKAATASASPAPAAAATAPATPISVPTTPAATPPPAPTLQPAASAKPGPTGARYVQSKNLLKMERAMKGAELVFMARSGHSETELLTEVTARGLAENPSPAQLTELSKLNISEKLIERLKGPEFLLTADEMNPTVGKPTAAIPAETKASSTPAQTTPAAPPSEPTPSIEEKRAALEVRMKQIETDIAYYQRNRFDPSYHAPLQRALRKVQAELSTLPPKSS